MTNDLSGGIDELSTKGMSIDRHRYDGCCHVFLEGFKEVVAQQHQIVPCGICRKSFEGQLFMTKGFQRTVSEFIRSPVVITGQNRFSFEPLLFFDGAELLVDWFSLANIGNDPYAVSYSAESFYFCS